MAISLTKRVGILAICLIMLGLVFSPVAFSGGISILTGKGSPHPELVGLDLDHPEGVAAGEDGTIYVSNSRRHVIVAIKDGIAKTFAGIKNSIGKFSTDLSVNRLSNPVGLAKSLDGDELFIVESEGGNRVVGVLGQTVRKVVATETRAQGAGTASIDGNDAATDTQLSTPTWIALGKEGRMVVTDTGYHRVVEIKDGKSRLLAGTGGGGSNLDPNGDATKSQLNRPIGVAIDDDGTVLVVEKNNNRVVAIKDGKIRVIVGTGKAGNKFDGNDATQTQLSGPTGITLTKKGTLIIADTNHNQIVAVTNWRGEVPGAIKVIAGTGKPGNRFDANDATSTELHHPASVAVLNDQLVICDTWNSRLLLMPLEEGEKG